MGTRLEAPPIIGFRFFLRLCNFAFMDCRTSSRENPIPSPEPTPLPDPLPSSSPSSASDDNPPAIIEPTPAPEPPAPPAPTPEPVVRPEPAPELPVAPPVVESALEPQPEPSPEPQPEPAPEPPAIPEPASKPAPEPSIVAPKPIPAPKPEAPAEKPKVPRGDLLAPHVQEDKVGVLNGGIILYGTPAQPQVIGEDGKLTPAPPLPNSGGYLDPEAITTAETFIGQAGGVTFNSPDIAVPVEPIEINLDIPGVGEAAQALANTYVALARGFLDDGKLSAQEINAAFAKVDKRGKKEE